MIVSKKKKLYYDKVIALYRDEGKSANDIIKELPVSIKTVQHWIHDFVVDNPCYARDYKRGLYIEEMMGLYQKGASRKELADKYSVSMATISNWIHDYVHAHPESGRKSNKDLYYDKAILLHKEKGMGATKISRIIPVPAATISAWLRNFADGGVTVSPREETPSLPRQEEGTETEMKKRNSNDADIESLRKEIDSLKKQLSKETLRADAYDEMINIAEKKFNIAIRKKAGAKQ